MKKRLALIHTGHSLAPLFTDLCREIIPGVDLFNMVDESLIQNTIAAGALTPNTFRRVAGLVQSAEEAGADVVLVTCSSIGPAVEVARSFVDIPVLRVDQPMADEAVRTGERIGVIATLPTTLANAGSVSGSFLISSFEETGEHDGAVEFSATFMSTGAVTYTASSA